MGKLKKNEKKTLLHKLLEFKLAGTVSYAKYLATQLESSEGVAIRKAYTRYIKKEIASTAKKIARLEEKLKKSAPKVEKVAKVAKPKAVAAPKVVKASVAKPVAAASMPLVKRATRKPAAAAKPQPTKSAVSSVPKKATETKK